MDSPPFFFAWGVYPKTCVIFPSKKIRRFRLPPPKIFQGPTGNNSKFGKFLKIEKFQHIELPNPKIVGRVGLFGSG